MTSLEKPWYISAIRAFLCSDVPRLTGIPVSSLARDFSTLERRLSTEGESFLTKTLPSLGKSIDIALQGKRPLLTTAFRKRRRSALPVFVQGLLRRVFLDDGWVRDRPCTTSIFCLRQLCFWCKKIEKGYSDESLQSTLEDVINIDQELPSHDHRFSEREIRVAETIIRYVFKRCLKHVGAYPQHGPGAVSTGESVVEKRRFRRAFARLERVFRPIPTFFSLRDASEDPTRVTGRISCDYGLSRLAFVEKDSSGPRVIGLEPAEYQWCQQSVKNCLYRHIESHPITSGHVNFTDQSINRRLTANWADYDTLDMSKASDRNSFALVKQLFERTPVWPYLQASRTPGTVLPNGEILWFKKFAPMGSATCFPVQAMVYYALACAGLHIRGGFPLGLALRNVFVYGDDLVVPHGSFPYLKEVFESAYLRFNEDKCCTFGRFRESCGMDAYDGVDVTPVRMRKVYPSRSSIDLVPIVKHANSLAFRGLWASSFAFREAALKNFPNLRKLNLKTSPRSELPILYWYSVPEVETVQYRTSDSVTTVKGWTFRPFRLEVPEDVEGFCLRESLSRGGPVGSLHLNRGSVNRAVDAKYSGELRKRKFTVVREYSTAREY